MSLPFHKENEEQNTDSEKISLHLFTGNTHWKNAVSEFHVSFLAWCPHPENGSIARGSTERKEKVLRLCKESCRREATGPGSQFVFGNNDFRLDRSHSEGHSWPHQVLSPERRAAWCGHHSREGGAGAWSGRCPAAPCTMGGRKVG